MQALPDTEQRRAKKSNLVDWSLEFGDDKGGKKRRNGNGRGGKGEIRTQKSEMRTFSACSLYL